MFILLVDDKQAILDVISSLLEQNGYRVQTATNGLDAYEKASTEAFNNCLGKLYLTTTTDNITKYTGFKCEKGKEDAYAHLYRVPKHLVIYGGEDTQEAGAIFTTTIIPPKNLEFMETKPNIAYKKEDFTNDKFKPLK